MAEMMEEMGAMEPEAMDMEYHPAKDKPQKKCSVSEKGLSIGEEPDKCCCCFPLTCGLYMITIGIFLTGLNTIGAFFAVLSSNIGASIVLLVCMAPLILGAFFVLLFWCKGADR